MQYIIRKVFTITVFIALIAVLDQKVGAFPVITNIVETGGDNEPTDTVTAKWTGVTYVGGVANEPVPGLAAGAAYTVGLFDNHAPNFVDRNHRYTNASATALSPSYLAGQEYIMSGNDNRDNAGYRLDVSVAQDVRVYLLIDNRLGDTNNANPPTFDATHMQWVLNEGWMPVITGVNRAGSTSVPDELGIDEGADGTINQWFSIYTKRFPAGTFQLRQADNGGQNMYGVVVTPSTFPQGAQLYYVAGFSDVTVEVISTGQRLSLHLVDQNTQIAASAPFPDGSATDQQGVPVPAPPPLPAIAPEPLSPPPEFNMGGCEIHMEVVTMDMTDGQSHLLIGLPYANKYPELFFNPNLFVGNATNAASFGEMESESSDSNCATSGFPAKSYFDVFHILETPFGTFFNKQFTQMRLRPTNGTLAVEIPPYGYAYELINGPIDLYDINNPNGPPVARTIAAHHEVNNRAPFPPSRLHFMSGFSDVSVQVIQTGEMFSFHLVDSFTRIAASAPFPNGSATDQQGAPVPAPQPLSPIAIEPLLPPVGFNLGGCEIHMEVVSMDMTDGQTHLLIGLPYAEKFPSLYFNTNLFQGSSNANSFGEMESESREINCTVSGFPARSYFDIFHLLETPFGTFFNKRFSQMKLVETNGTLAVEIPPYGFTYVLVNGPIDLFDINNPNGSPVARIVAAAHGVHNEANSIFLSDPRVASNTFAFTFTAPAGRNYFVEASSNLVSWFTIRNLTNFDGRTTVAVPGVGNFRQQFYRARFGQ